MPRVCTVCTHSDRNDIDLALLSGVSPRDLASRYVTAQGAPLGRMALQRHKEDHLPESMVKGKEVADIAHGDDLIAELKTCIERVVMLSDACDEWLRDPEDPTKYFIGARSEDIKVSYEEQKGDKTIRKKAPLSELLARIEGRYAITAVETKHADPRELLLKSYDRMESRLELVAKLLGMINDAPTVNITINPQWLELRAVIVQSLSPYPEARLAVAAALAKLEGGADAR